MVNVPTFVVCHGFFANGGPEPAVMIDIQKPNEVGAYFDLPNLPLYMTFRAKLLFIQIIFYISSSKEDSRYYNKPSDNICNKAKCGIRYIISIKTNTKL